MPMPEIALLHGNGQSWLYNQIIMPKKGSIIGYAAPKRVSLLAILELR
jgi:hypothetical protein